MYTPAEFGPVVLLYVLVAYIAPFLLFLALLALLPSVRLARRLGLSRAMATWSLIPLVGPAVFLSIVAYLKVSERSTRIIDLTQQVE